VSELADALCWLADLESESAQIVVFDPPYAVGTPVRGREDGAAGSVFAPFSFLHKSLLETARVLVPGGVAILFADWKRMHDLLYIASVSGLRPSTCLAWVRQRPGTGGLFRSAWDPIQLVSRGVPRANDRAAVRNVIEADYDFRRIHPYAKPAKIFRDIFNRCAQPYDLVVDPFAGSGVTQEVAQEMKLRWIGCDIDPAYADRVEELGG
jgi:site-specific DNA-methyltransferase (adenine-specific)